MHAITKNVQSIRDDNRWLDFVLELEGQVFDILFLTETWRSDVEEAFISPFGDYIYLSGGCNHQGVGLCVAKSFHDQITCVQFHAYSCRVCALRFVFRNLKFCAIAVYMPTTWHSDDEVEEVYGLLDLLLDECTYNSILPLLGGDFNARLGACENGDDSAVLGTWGLGRRNARGQLLARWVLQHGLCILSRLETNMPMAESWTCKRVADNALTQLDFIIGGLQFEHEKSWHDNCLGTGLDHRCVHSILRVRIAKRSLTKRISGLKNWQPFVDNDGKASGFQSSVRKLLRTNTNPTLPALEHMLLTAGREHGHCKTVRFTFRPSRRLRGLCSMRRSTADVAMRKMLSFEIRRLHRQEIRFWKNSRLRQSLGRASHWKALRNMIHTSAGQAYASQPPLDEFADALERIFSGNNFVPDRPAAQTETDWTLAELKCACARLKVNKACDESGLAAELLQHVPDEFLVELLRLFNGILQHGSAPAEWKNTSFTMLPKKTRAKLVTDFRPIANIRLFYKVFAYMILSRVEQSLESFQPEAQHGFRSGRRMEEHVLTTNLILDKSRAAGLPLWIISLDLSKAFDTVKWDTLWEALRRQNISDQLIWILQCLYHDQTGVVRDGAGASRKFDILSGVRQGCVLSPRLFCAALELAMSEWRAANPQGGIDLGDDMLRLLDLRFADDVLIFANTKEEVQNLMDSLVRHLAAAGLMLNTSKTVALTTEAQPPSFIQVGDSHMIKVLGNTESHKWLGCMLCACPGQDSDVEYHLQQAAKAFQKHRWMLQCRECSIKHRLRYFEAIVSSTACFAAQHRPLYRKHLQKYDVQFRKLIRRIVGPPPGTNWSAQWHDILHEWNLRVDHWARASGISSWSQKCMVQYWKFASYIANLPAERWVRRALAWNPLPTNRSRGRPQQTWDTKLEMFCRFKALDNWESVARNAVQWDALLPTFLDFCSM